MSIIYSINGNRPKTKSKKQLYTSRRDFNKNNFYKQWRKLQKMKFSKKRTEDAHILLYQMIDDASRGELDTDFLLHIVKPSIEALIFNQV